MSRNNLKGFSLVELMIAAGIGLALLAAIASMFSVGQNVWTATDVHLRLQSIARIALTRAAEEIRQTNEAHLTLFDNTGVNSSDIIRFSIPVMCEDGGSFLDENGDVAYWRAPLTWGCEDFSCMEGDDDCSTVEYSKIEYAMTDQGQLIRRVLNDAGDAVAEDIMVSEGIVDFQVVLLNRVVTLSVDLTVQTAQGRELSEISSAQIFLRNSL